MSGDVSDDFHVAYIGGALTVHHYPCDDSAEFGRMSEEEASKVKLDVTGGHQCFPLARPWYGSGIELATFLRSLRDALGGVEDLFHGPFRDDAARDELALTHQYLTVLLGMDGDRMVHSDHNG